VGEFLLAVGAEAAAFHGVDDDGGGALGAGIGHEALEVGFERGEGADVGPDSFSSLWPICTIM